MHKSHTPQQKDATNLFGMGRHVPPISQVGRRLKLCFSHYILIKVSKSDSQVKP